MDLRTARKRQNLTQIRLAKLSGLSNVSISLYETGKTMPGVVAKEKIEKILNTKIDWLSGRGNFRYKNQTFSKLEERLRKVLYEIYTLSESEQTEFKQLARSYINRI